MKSKRSVDFLLNMSHLSLLEEIHVGEEFKREIDRESHYEVREKSSANNIPSNPQRWLRLWHLAIVERVSEPALPVIRLVNTTIINIEPSSINWRNQMQRSKTKQ